MNMKKWLKKYFPTTKSLLNSYQLKKFKRFFKHADLSSYDHKCVARGVAAGLAGAVLPGFQLLYAALLAILLRGNLLIALFCTLITNPFTVVPITYFIYFIGSKIIGNGQTNFVIQNFRWDISSFHAFWFNLSAWLFQFGKAFLIGLPIVSFCLGIIGYFGTILIWNLFIKRKGGRA
jgi:uncharacterized protein (DUF2062 family)